MIMKNIQRKTYKLEYINILDNCYSSAYRGVTTINQLQESQDPRWWCQYVDLSLNRVLVGNRTAMTRDNDYSRQVSRNKDDSQATGRQATKITVEPLITLRSRSNRLCITGIVNQVKITNTKQIVLELLVFSENLIRGRGLFARSGTPRATRTWLFCSVT